MARTTPRRIPAAIRFNNPGAMYPGPVSRHFGSLRTETIGGGHKIAVFDTPQQGAAAHFGLLGRSYTGMTLDAAIAKWSGGNSNRAYADYVAKQTGLTRDTVLTREMFRDPRIAIPFARAQATWEAGMPTPITAQQWAEGHALAVQSPFSVGGRITQRTLPSPTTPPAGMSLPTNQSSPPPQQRVAGAMGQRGVGGDNGLAGGLGVVDPMNPGNEPRISPVSPPQEATPPQRPPQATPVAGQTGKGPASGGVPQWAIDAFARADNQPVSPVQGTATLGSIFSMPGAPPSTYDWMENRNKPFPKLGGMMFGGGGIGSFFSGIFSG